MRPRSPTPALDASCARLYDDSSLEYESTQADESDDGADEQVSGCVSRRNYFDWTNPDSDGGRRTLALCRVVLDTQVKGSGGEPTKGIFHKRAKSAVCKEAAATILRLETKTSDGRDLFCGMSELTTKSVWDKALANAHAYKVAPDDEGMCELYREILRLEEAHDEAAKAADAKVQEQRRIKETRIDTALERAGSAKKHCPGKSEAAVQGRSAVDQVVALMSAHEQLLVYLCKHSAWGNVALRERFHNMTLQLQKVQIETPELHGAAATEYTRRL